jgi:hypothetical protein
MIAQVRVGKEMGRCKSEDTKRQDVGWANQEVNGQNEKYTS